MVVALTGFVRGPLLDFCVGGINTLFFFVGGLRVCVCVRVRVGNVCVYFAQLP